MENQELVVWNHDTGKSANIIYILYLVGLVFGLTALIGLIMAYINRDGAPEWVKSHYRYQIRTFWIGLLFLAIGAVTSIFVIGWLILLGWVIWLIVRCVKGMQLIGKQQAVANPASWTF